MKLTLLLDLDDTLLSNVVAGFIPAYLQALGNHIEGFAPDTIIRHVMLATREMILKRTPAQTMEQVFDMNFYPALGTTKQTLQKSIQHFYKDVFPTLKPVTSPIPEAVEVIDYAFQQGWTVIIATNPLFPRTATLQRLEWANVPLDRYDFALVTTYEGLHFAKPSTAYFAEALAQVGWPDQPVAMIGNSLEDDILPASNFGIPCFWVNGSQDEMPAGLNRLSRAGKVEDILGWLKEVQSAQDNVEMKFVTPPAILAVLKSTPAALDTWAEDLTDEQLTARPKPGEWSLNEIFCHLRDVDQEVNWPRLQKICEEENPFLPGVVTDLWAEERNYFNQDGRKALLEFTEIRTKLINLLEAIPPDQWDRPARHAIFGPTDLHELAGFILTHDQTHIRQAKETIRAVKA